MNSCRTFKPPLLTYVPCFCLLRSPHVSQLALAGTDLLVQAKTGTGKTIAFLLPAIERLLASKMPLHGVSILVLAPTRELALQIEEEASLLLAHHPKLTVAHAIGGTKYVRPAFPSSLLPD